MNQLWIAFVCLMFFGCAQTELAASEPAVSEADASALTEPETKPTVPSFIFVQFLNQQAPVIFCQQDPGIACLNMPEGLCAASIQSSIERCGPKLLDEWPASFEESEENAIRYSKSYRNCILQDWVDEFGLQEERLAACGINLE